MKIPTPEELPDLLQPRGRNPRLALLVGVLLIVVLTWLSFALQALVGYGLTFLVYMLAVIVAAWLGGGVPGIVVTMLSAIVGVYFFLGNEHSFLPLGANDQVRTAVFLLVGLLVSGVCEALHRSRERIEERTRELHVEIRERQMHEQVRKELERRKDQFLAVLSHELRNPLTPIVNAAALLHARQSSDPLVERSAQMIDRHARHMVHLVDDLLDVARIERGTFELRREHTEVGQIIQAAVEHCRPAILEKRQRFTVRMPPRPTRIYGDYVRLVQVVTNLLNNASNYTLDEGRIDLDVQVDGDTLRIDVRDDGKGLASRDIERIFEMFERGTMTGGTSGLGIGLALVRQITTMHGGEVSATSDGDGKGSTFSVQLPGVTSEVAPVAEPSSLAGAATDMHAFRILVVDDNPDLVESLAAVLRLLGHQVEAASNGEDALTQMAASTPDLVLLDVGMPGVSGYEVARRAALERWRANMMLVAMTGWGRDEDRQRAMEAGFDLHVVKPLDLERLRALLASLRQVYPVR